MGSGTEGVGSNDSRSLGNLVEDPSRGKRAGFHISFAVHCRGKEVTRARAGYSAQGGRNIHFAYGWGGGVFDQGVELGRLPSAQ